MKKLIYSKEDLNLILTLKLEEKDKEIERLNKGYCEFKKECGEYAKCSREEQIKEIERLNNIINKKEQFLGDNIKRLEREVVKRDNIINELEKELKEDYKIWMCNSRSNGKSVKFGIDVCKTHFYNRLQELKGSDKE